MLCGRLVTLGPIIGADIPTIFLWEDDVDAAQTNHVYRPAVWRNVEEHWLNIGNDSSRIYFAIRKFGSLPLIGYVQITAIDPIHRSAMLGIRIGEKMDRGQGFGTEALKLAIDYCWNHLNLSRIGLTVFENNERARKLYTAIGFEVEGVLKRAVFINGHWFDVYVMGLLHPSRDNSNTNTPLKFSQAR